MEKINLINYGIIKSKLPKNLYRSILKECLNKNKKEKFISGLTNPGVANHYYLEKNLNEIKIFLNEMQEKYIISFPEYLQHIKVLTNPAPLTFGRPWINYQKKGEHIPLHIHDGIFSFNIWVKIPVKSVFSFNYSTTIGKQVVYNIDLSKEDEGTVVLFPSLLQHIVYPFQKSNQTRISIAGNIFLDNGPSSIA